MHEGGYTSLSPAVSVRSYEGLPMGQLPHLQSWVQLVERTLYEKCDFSDSGLRGCDVSNAVFKSCKFDGADLSEAIFRECLFLDCTFPKTNFHKVTFQGCTLESTERTRVSPFVGAGMAHTKFIPSKTNGIRTSLLNLNMEQIGFRNGIFSECVIEDTTFNYVSFEDSLLDRCTIDVLDLTHCSCRAVRIKNCTIGRFKTNLEKLMTTIGIRQLLGENQFEIVHYENGTPQSVTDIDQVFSLIRGKMEELVLHGRFFEVLNFILAFASEYSLDRFIPKQQLELLIPSTNLPAERSGNKTFSETREKNQVLYATIANVIPLFMERGVGISVDSLLYTLRLTSEYNISSPHLYTALSALARQLFRTTDHAYIDNPTIALVQYYLREMAGNIPTGRIEIRFTHPRIGFSDTEKRSVFFNQIDDLLSHALSPGEYRFERVAHGSLEHIFSTAFFFKLMCFLLVIGCRLQAKRINGKWTVAFSFDGTQAVKDLTKLLDLASGIMKKINWSHDHETTLAEAQDAIDKAEVYTEQEYFDVNEISGDAKQVYFDKLEQAQLDQLMDPVPPEITTHKISRDESTQNIEVSSESN